MEQFIAERDHLIIRGTMYGEPQDQPKPAVILSHGFMADSSMCKDYAKLLADMGYLAFTFDFCGGGLRGKSDGSTTDMSVLSEVRDLRAVISYVLSLPYTDQRVHLFGCSQGGFVSALTAVQTPEVTASLTLLYPAFCIPDDARSGQMMFAKFDPQNIPETIPCGPMKLGACYVKNVIEMEPWKEIHGYEGPVLYLQGTSDRIVDVSYARRAREEYPDCMYREIEGGGHMFKGKHERAAREYIRIFFTQRLLERISSIPFSLE